MRGIDERSGSLFRYVDLEARVWRDHPRRVIREIANVVLSDMTDDLAVLYTNFCSVIVSGIGEAALMTGGDLRDPRGGLMVQGPAGPAEPTYWSFGQIASLIGAPANYLREMPAPIVADCLNYGLRFARDIEEVGLLFLQHA